MVFERKKSIKAEISVPGDKSISHRAVMIGALARGITEIEGFLIGEDCISTIECFRKMNVGIEILDGNKVKVYGRGMYGLTPPTVSLNTRNSGTTIRMLSGILAGQPFNSILTGDDRGLRRPLARVVQPLRKMGASIIGKEDGNFCPLMINGTRLHGTQFDLQSGVQTKSSVIFASLFAEGETIVKEQIKSRDHTELMLKHFGAEITINGNEVRSKNINDLFCNNISIPGDVSCAAYFVAAGLLIPDSEIIIKNVGINDTRTGYIKILKKMGAVIEIVNIREANNEPRGDIIAKSSSLKGIEIDEKMVPGLIDEIAVLAVAAAAAKGNTVINVPEETLTKLSGRIRLIVSELSKMGVKITHNDRQIVIEGGSPLKGTVVESYNDERIAMSLAIAGCIADDETVIRRSQCVDVMYPEFFELLRKL